MTRRRQPAVLGNNSATRVLRLISYFSRSNQLVVRIRTRFSPGNANTEKLALRFVSAQLASLGCELRQPSIAKPSSSAAKARQWTSASDGATETPKHPPVAAGQDTRGKQPAQHSPLPGRLPVHAQRASTSRYGVSSRGRLPQTPRPS